MLDKFHVVGGAHVRLAAANCDNGPMLVQANLRFCEHPARIQALTNGHSNILPAVQRLERQLHALARPWHPRPWPDDSRRALSTPGPGSITRRKSVPLRVLEPLAAARIMDAMDYDVHLFTDAETGDDAIVYRAGPSGLKLARQYHVNPPRPQPDPSVLTINPRPAPVSPEHAAAARLCEHGLPFLFYTDRDTGRGHLLYRRYDAGLTLVTPAADTAAQ
ncbi:sigma 54 modulation/S30EA ribosomal C-terminal domain-containing protein [Nocardia huaxiensis]|uniref:Sigma 54 modulation/S30EA ribosomal C-terminal domain-containing protein n=2 Tax=Nocardia huaxiensis TaxID=2755382 RepID=A0A7D6ZP23_9NOCA|nr:sigma 54 modulation/S30EA ribosomal C-terminal domain-containing protein [Nocardia huaxiensis]